MVKNESWRSAQHASSNLDDSERDFAMLFDGDIAMWQLDSERKSGALALLGNRSLARRKLNDSAGALFDAVACIRLDPNWIRGYLRKAAALRQDEKLDLARICVLEGLAVDRGHSGLIEMLESIDTEIQTKELKSSKSTNENEIITQDGVNLKGNADFSAALTPEKLREPEFPLQTTATVVS